MAVGMNQVAWLSSPCGIFYSHCHFTYFLVWTIAIKLSYGWKFSDLHTCTTLRSHDSKILCTSIIIGKFNEFYCPSKAQMGKLDKYILPVMSLTDKTVSHHKVAGHATLQRLKFQRVTVPCWTQIKDSCFHSIWAKKQIRPHAQVFISSTLINEIHTCWTGYWEYWIILVGSVLTLPVWEVVTNESENNNESHTSSSV